MTPKEARNEFYQLISDNEFTVSQALDILGSIIMEISKSADISKDLLVKWTEEMWEAYHGEDNG